MVFGLGFVLVISVTNGQVSFPVVVGGFDEFNCAEARDYALDGASYKDDTGTYRILAASCVRDLINKT